MKAVIFLAAFLLAANAFSFGNVFKGIGNDIKHAATQAGNGIKHAATQAGNGIQHAATQAGNGIQHAATQAGNGIKHAATDAGKGIVHVADQAGHDITYAASSFASHIKTLPGDMKKEFQIIGAKVEKLAQQGATIASDVAQDIAADATEAIQVAAQEAVKVLGIALECAEVVLENAQLFKTCAAIADDPTQLISNWNDIDNELYNICVGCSGLPASKFDWLKKIQLSQGDMAVIKCSSDVIELAEGAGEIAASDGIDVEAVLQLINSIVGMVSDCPTAINYVEQLVAGSQNVEFAFLGSQEE